MQSHDPLSDKVRLRPRLTHEQPLELAKMLRLPLTEDAYLKHTVDLSLGYYKSVMAVNR